MENPPDLTGLLAGATAETVIYSKPVATELQIATVPQPLTESLTVPFDQIPAIPASYLWPGVLARRTPVMVVAPGGTGKGLLVAAIAGIVTTRRPFPNEPEGTVREPGSVIIVAPEDDANEDLAFRLKAAGADLSLVHNLTYLPDGSRFSLPYDFRELRAAITEVNGSGPRVDFIALDPLMAISDISLASARNARALIEELQQVTHDEDTTMVITHHTVKSGAVAGNQAVVDAMRVVWMLSRANDGDPCARVIDTGWKTNRSAGPSIRYRIEGDGEDAHAVFARPEDEATVPGSRAARLRLITGVVDKTMSASEALAELKKEKEKPDGQASTA